MRDIETMNFIASIPTECNKRLLCKCLTILSDFKEMKRVNPFKTKPWVLRGDDFFFGEIDESELVETADGDVASKHLTAVNGSNAECAVVFDWFAGMEVLLSEVAAETSAENVSFFEIGHESPDDIWVSPWKDGDLAHFEGFLDDSWG